ncbi:MAG TPA: hypothetical protein VNJ04_20660 [Gemmatimonadaceae bacterium]|nr:hypothetical protein [Gemmatimonadaceae bacterium]
MAEARRAAVYYKTLCREGVPDKHAQELTKAYILRNFTLGDILPDEKKEPWELGGDES